MQQTYAAVAIGRTALSPARWNCSLNANFAILALAVLGVRTGRSLRLEPDMAAPQVDRPIDQLTSREPVASEHRRLVAGRIRATGPSATVTAARRERSGGRAPAAASPN